jgi:hypothetical protein
MPPLSAHRHRTAAFQGWVWLLLVVLLLQGGAGAVVQVLGRAHTHHAVQAAPAPSWLDIVLAWREARLLALDSTAVFRHATVAAADHHHNGLERHHHGRDDTTVQAVDSAPGDATADTGQGAGGSVALAWGPTAADRADFRSAVATSSEAWRVAPQPSWSSALIRLLERPPRA